MPAAITADHFVKKLKGHRSPDNDKQDLIHKATGGWLREAGKRDQARLFRFLDKHAATMPRTALRYAIEHLDRKQRDHYLGLKQAGRSE